jgi:hypothetical protein
VRLSLRSAEAGRGEVIGEVAVLRSAAEIDLNIQNFGSRDLGRFGGLLRGQFYGLTGLGDRTSIAIFSTADFEEQQTVQVGHDFRVGGEGLTFSGAFTYAWAEPDIDDPNLRVTARTLIGTAEASFPFLRSQAETARGAIGFDLINQRVRLNGLPISRDRLRVAFLRLDADATDPQSLVGALGYSAAEPRWRVSGSLQARQGLDVFDASEPCGPTFARCTGVGSVPLSRLEGDPTSTVLRGEVFGEYRPVPAITFALGVAPSSAAIRCSASRNSRPATTRSAAATIRAACSATMASARSSKRGSARSCRPRPIARRSSPMSSWTRPRSTMRTGSSRTTTTSSSRPARACAASTAARRSTSPSPCRWPAPVFRPSAPIRASSSRSPRASSPGASDMTQLAHLADRRIGLRNRRETLLVSAAVALALALMPSSEVDAQTGNFSGGFRGTPSFNPDQYNITTPSANTTLVRMRAPVATINWTPDNSGTGSINFLPQGNFGIFENDPDFFVGNFAVLNRIIPADTTRRIDFNGRVISQLRDAAGNVSGPGGTVAFYSPGGIFISSTAVFDVGSLLLTTLDPINFDSINPDSPSFQFRGGDGSTSAVVTAAGSQINATANGSYVGVIAPRVEHNGAIRVNGSAGLIAGESVDLTIADGLFNIVVNTGTSVANAITSNGSIGGPASSGVTDNHVIYAVAVPKNQAITTVLRGSVGFDAATTATVENGEIILSAGHNVNGRTIATSPVAGSLGASAVLDSGSYSSDVRVRAVTDASVRTFSADANFAGDVTLLGSQRAFIAAEMRAPSTSWATQSSRTRAATSSAPTPPAAAAAASPPSAAKPPSRARRARRSTFAAARMLMPACAA